MSSIPLNPIPAGWPREFSVPVTAYADYRDWPKITIITPSYQQGNYIEDTILSVLNQNYPNLEYFIMDGGSQDNTRSILEKYSDKLAGWISEKDQGQSDAINKGLNKSSGEIVNWLCSDDMLMPGALLNIAQAFRQKETNIVCGWSRQFSQDQDFGLACTSLYRSLPETIYISHICQPATWYRMNILKRYAPINIGLHYAMDSEIWLQYIFNHGLTGVVEIPNVLTAYRYHESSKTISLDYKFKEDKMGLIYPVLSCLKAPEILLNYYKDISRSTIYEKPEMQTIHPTIPKREVIEYYILETLSAAKIKRQYLKIAQLLLLLFRINPVRPLYIWKHWLKTRIAPKLFN